MSALRRDGRPEELDLADVTSEPSSNGIPTPIQVWGSFAPGGANRSVWPNPSPSLCGAAHPGGVLGEARARLQRRAGRREEQLHRAGVGDVAEILDGTPTASRFIVPTRIAARLVPNPSPASGLPETPATALVERCAAAPPAHHILEDRHSPGVVQRADILVGRAHRNIGAGRAADQPAR